MLSALEVASTCTNVTPGEVYPHHNQLLIDTTPLLFHHHYTGICGFSALDNGDNVFVSQLVGKTDSLWLMLDGLSVDNSHAKVIDDGLVNRVTLYLVSIGILEKEGCELTKSSTVHFPERKTTGEE